MSIVCMSAAAAGGHHDVSGAEGVQAYLYRDDIISMCTLGRHHDVVQQGGGADQHHPATEGT